MKKNPNKLISRSCLNLLLFHTHNLILSVQRLFCDRLVMWWNIFRLINSEEHPPPTNSNSSCRYLLSLRFTNRLGPTSKVHHVMSNERCTAENAASGLFMFKLENLLTPNILLWAHLWRSSGPRTSCPEPGISPPSMISLCFLISCDWLVFALTSAFI